MTRSSDALPCTRGRLTSIRMLRSDLENLQQAGLKPTLGDARCLLFGHLIRLAVWQLRAGWCAEKTEKHKLGEIEAALQEIHPVDLLQRLAAQALSSTSDIDLLARMRVAEVPTIYDTDDELPF